MKVLVITAMWPTAENPAFGSFVRSQVQCLQEAGIHVEVLILNGRIRKLIYPKGVVQLHRRLADRSIDLVHAHYGYVGIVGRTQWRVPLVVTYHGDDALGTINVKGKLKTFSRVTAAVNRAVGSLADAVIVQSTQMASRFRRANVHVIPHEVDLNTFQPVLKERARNALDLRPDKKYLLFAANPEIAVKRFPLARAAAESLRLDDPSVELVIVFKEPQHRLALYMSACDALVFPSYQEGSPNIVKQAMACNLPIVATDVGDVKEIIGETKGCCICAPDVNDFAESIRLILRTGERTEGRDRVRSLAGPFIARRVIDIYKNVLQRRAVEVAAQTEG